MQWHCHIHHSPSGLYSSIHCNVITYSIIKGNMNCNKHNNPIWGNWNWEKWVTIDMLHPTPHATSALIRVLKDRRLPQPCTCDWSSSCPCRWSTSASMEQARASPALPSSPLRRRMGASWSTAYSFSPFPPPRRPWDHFPVVWLGCDRGDGKWGCTPEDWRRTTMNTSLFTHPKS